MTRKNLFKAGCLALVLALMLAAPVFAAFLTFVEFQQDGGGGVDGLDSASSVTASPDGKHVYAAGQNDDAVAVFSVPFAPIGGYTEPVSLLALSWSWIALAAAVGLGSIGMAAALRKRTAGR